MRVIFTCVYTHLNFSRVNKTETRYKVLSLNVKSSEGQPIKFREMGSGKCSFWLDLKAMIKNTNKYRFESKQ